MSRAADVLAHYPAPLRGPIASLGNHGGFSGARLFRVETQTGSLCLRAWPTAVTATQLDFIHGLMRRATDAGLDFVPRVLSTGQGATVVSVAGQLWELTTWMPGTTASPTAQRLQAACSALAYLHRVWADTRQQRAICPAVERRLAAVRYSLPIITAGWQPPADALDPIAPWAQRAWAIVRQRLPELPALLTPWLARPVPVQPCVCDVWSDHVLFTGDRVTGVVDFGSCKVDHVAVDLARLLGSLAGDDAALWAVGLDAYAEHRPLTAEERSLAHDLDRSGTIVAAANWLRWLYREERVYPDRDAVARRVAGLVQRLG